MTNQKNKGSAGVIAIVVFVILVLVLVMTNRWLQEQANSIVSEPVDVPIFEPVSQKEKAPKTKKGTGEVIRRTRFSPDRKYEINVFYQGGAEIARNRSSKEGAYDQTGEIPDGKVKFINESSKTYGVEHYRNQERHGPAKIYYSDDVLQKEIYYQYGKLMTTTEYYHDRTIRMEEDYTDAREHLDERDVGIGKVYFRDGTLKYEWYLTVTKPIGFEKSYDGKGRLTGEFYFDEYGQPIEAREVPSIVNTPSEAGAPPRIRTPKNIDIPLAVEKMPKQIFIPAN